MTKASAEAKPISFRILLMTLLSSWGGETRKGVKPAFDAPWCNHEYRRLMSRSLRHVSDGSRGGAVFDSFAILCSMLDGTRAKGPVHIAQRLIIHRRRGTHGPEMEPGGGTRGVCGGSRRHTAHKRRHAKAVVVVMPNKIPRTNDVFLPKIRKTERLCAGFTSRGPQRAR